jgi:hypothetical protein
MSVSLHLEGSIKRWWQDLGFLLEVFPEQAEELLKLKASPSDPWLSVTKFTREQFSAGQIDKSDLLCSAFSWDSTPQGYDFWHSLMRYYLPQGSSE